MKNKNLFKAIVKISLVSMVLSMSFQFSLLPVRAADLSAMSDTMSRLMQGVAANHDIHFTTATAVAAGETIVIEFDPATNAFAMPSLVFGDISVTGMTLVANVGACSVAPSEAYPVIQDAGPADTITFTVCAGDTVAAGAKTVALANNHVTNPAGAGSYTITIGGTMTDSGSLAVGIVANDQVTVTATVEPTFTFSLAQLSLTFGNYTSASLRYANTTTGATSEPAAGATTALTVSTNATSGATITIQDEGSGAAAGLWRSIAPTHLIAAADSTTVLAAATEVYGAYGFNVSGSPSPLVIDEGFDNDTTSDLAISRTPQTLATSGGPVSSGGVGVVFVGNTLATTPAGNYADTITFIATGTF